MKRVPLRRFTTVVPYLTEMVLVTSNDEVIGTYRPAQPGEVYKEATVDNVNKAIKPDQVKQQPSGKLSKGLGELPGGDRASVVDTREGGPARGLAGGGRGEAQGPEAGALPERAAGPSYGTGRPAPKPKK